MLHAGSGAQPFASTKDKRVIQPLSGAHIQLHGTASPLQCERVIWLCSLIETGIFLFCSSRFTLHGLWPNYEKGHCPGKKGAWPQNCDDSSTDLPPECDCPFEIGLLSDLQTAMLENWPSYGQANADFWKHEWDKHGEAAHIPRLYNNAVILHAHVCQSTLADAHCHEILHLHTM